MTIAPGRLRGMTPEMSYIEGVAAGDERPATHPRPPPVSGAGSRVSA